MAADESLDYVHQFFAGDEGAVAAFHEAVGLLRDPTLLYNPLLLSFLCASFSREPDIRPRTRADLCERMIGFLLEEPWQQDGDAPRDLVRQAKAVLAPVAFDTARSAPRWQEEIPATRLEELNQTHPHLGSFISRSTLLLEGETFWFSGIGDKRFVHRLLQEYLTALHLSSLDDASEIIDAIAWDVEWSEVLIFLAEMSSEGAVVDRLLDLYRRHPAFHEPLLRAIAVLQGLGNRAALEHEFSRLELHVDRVVKGGYLVDKIALVSQLAEGGAPELSWLLEIMQADGARLIEPFLSAIRRLPNGISLVLLRELAKSEDALVAVKTFPYLVATGEEEDLTLLLQIMFEMDERAPAVAEALTDQFQNDLVLAAFVRVVTMPIVGPIALSLRQAVTKSLAWWPREKVGPVVRAMTHSEEEAEKVFALLDEARRNSHWPPRGPALSILENEMDTHLRAMRYGERVAATHEDWARAIHSLTFLLPRFTPQEAFEVIRSLVVSVGTYNARDYARRYENISAEELFEPTTPEEELFEKKRPFEDAVGYWQTLVPDPRAVVADRAIELRFRAVAAFILAREGDSKAVRIFATEMLEAQDIFIETALFGLGFFPRDPFCAEFLFGVFRRRRPNLIDENLEGWQRRSLQLGDHLNLWGSKYVEGLRQARNRELVSGILSSWGKDAPVDHLLDAMQDEKPAVRRAVLKPLVDTASRAALERVLLALDDADPATRAAAATALLHGVLEQIIENPVELMEDAFRPDRTHWDGTYTLVHGLWPTLRRMVGPVWPKWLERFDQITTLRLPA